MEQSDATLLDDSCYGRAIVEFRTEQSAWYAADLLAAAIARHDRAIADEVVTFLARDKTTSPAARAFADAYRRGEDAELSPVAGDEIAARLQKARASLSEYPRNAVMWSDLALYYTLVGKLYDAEPAMRTAVRLATNQRFILRCGARFFVHQNDVERAHTLLRDAEATPHDPWLLAAEIATATAADGRSRLIQHGRSMLKSGNYHRGHLSELASALGRAEMDAPTVQRRQVRRLFHLSLESPTENSIAQAAWAHMRGTAIEGFESANAPRNFEARAWGAFTAGKFEKALDYAQKWFLDQPFSARPAELASFIATALMNKHDLAIRILMRATKPNPKAALLWNNLAFAHAMQNEVSQAKDAIQRAVESRPQSVTDQLSVSATRGMIAFREGQIGLVRPLS